MIVQNKIRNIFYFSGYYFISVILIISGISKLAAPAAAAGVLNMIGVFGEEISALLIAILSVFELSLGLFMIFKIQITIVINLCIILFLLFFGASIIGAVLGLKSDCGCFGDIIKNEIGWFMVFRNLIFLITSIYLARYQHEG
jgi:hypothetical protein